MAQPRWHSRMQVDGGVSGIRREGMADGLDGEIARLASVGKSLEAFAQAVGAVSAERLPDQCLLIDQWSFRCRITPPCGSTS